MNRRRSILWVVTTQWRGQAWSGGGDAQATTPALARLAARGINYAEATTPHPFGPFARAALLTGMTSPENGVRNYYDPLPTGTRTVAYDMAAAGYRTAYFGKWHLGQRDVHAPLVGEVHAKHVVPKEDRGGFDFWQGFESGFLLNDPWLHGSGLREPTRFRGYQSDVLVERAADWIGATAAPWFAVVSMEAPHPPYDAPLPDGIAETDPDRLSLRANVSPVAEVRARRELAGYYGHIAATDRAIGRLVAGLPEDVIVLVTSVHGDMHGSHGLFRKGWPYEESVRVPLVVAGAPEETSGAINHDPVSLLDLRAMSRAWAEGKPWQCQRDHAPLSMPTVVALPDQCDRLWHGWRTAGRKEIFLTDASPWLAFDLLADPLEQENVAEADQS